MSDIRLYKLDEKGLAHQVESKQVALEKHLQKILEDNLQVMLGITFLASEYPTGPVHRGRIDSLGLDENCSPVIIEYKRSSHESVINQGLFYLDWLMDHQAEFQLLVQEKLGKEMAKKIEWSVPRLLCIAADYTRYDEHAVKQINRNIELLQYRKFNDDFILLELVNSQSTQVLDVKGRSEINTDAINIKYKTISETFTELKGEFALLVEEVRSYLADIASDVQVKTLKYYEAYKRLKNFSCLEVKPSDKRIILFLKVCPESIDLEKGFSRDVRGIGHYGTGDLEVTIKDPVSFDKAKELIRRSYQEA